MSLFLCRHSRESGNPVRKSPELVKNKGVAFGMDSRFRENDGDEQRHEM